MTLELTTPLDITSVSLRESAAAIGDREAFKVGEVVVDHENLLLGREGATYRGLALEEARALGNLMVVTNRRWWHLNSSEVSRVKTEEPVWSISGWNTVLEPAAMLWTPTKDTVEFPAWPHIWRFRTYADQSGFVGHRKTSLIGVVIQGERIKPATPDRESYVMPLQGLENGPITRGQLLEPIDTPEDPNDLFYAAQLGWLRAAILKLGDKSADPVIK